MGPRYRRPDEEVGGEDVPTGPADDDLLEAVTRFVEGEMGEEGEERGGND